MTEKQLRIDGVNYLVMDGVVHDKKSGIELSNRLRKFKGIARCLKEIKTVGLFKRLIVFEILIPECNAIDYSNDGLM